MSHIFSDVGGRLESIVDLIALARDVCPHAVPNPDEVLSDERIATLLLDVVAQSGLEELPIDDYYWAEHLWDLQAVLRKKDLPRKKQLASVKQWILETDEHFVLDLCGFSFYHNAIIYDDVEFLFDAHNGYPLMGLALSTGGHMLSEEGHGYDLDHVEPAHVLGAALMVLAKGYRIPDDEFAVRFKELPMLAFQMLFFHILPQENPFCGELENENRLAPYYHWHEVPQLVAACKQYGEIIEASPDLAELMDPSYLFRNLLAIEEFA